MLADQTVKAGRRSFDDLLVWARGLDAERVWAIENCRHVCGALEPGKSDAIDAVAIARAAIREGLDTLAGAQLAGPELDVRLLVDHRERLVASAPRSSTICAGRSTTCGPSSRSRRAR